MKFSQKILASLVVLAYVVASGVAAANDDVTANFGAPSWQQAKTVMDQGKAIWMLELEMIVFF